MKSLLCTEGQVKRHEIFLTALKIARTKKFDVVFVLYVRREGRVKLQNQDHNLNALSEAKRQKKIARKKQIKWSLRSVIKERLKPQNLVDIKFIALKIAEQ